MTALLFAAMLVGSPAGQVAQVVQAQAAAAAPAEATVEQTTQPPGLPVSLDKIREALNRKSLLTLRGLQEQAAHFRVEIEERRKIEELLATLDFRTGPAPAGGIYGYEQQRLLNSATGRPLAQPFAAFSTGELITLAVQNLAIKYLGGRLLNAVANAERARAERAAREEVVQAMSEFCAAQTANGTGLQACSISASDR